MTVRYAIYWTPAGDDPLAAFGAAWLGRDPARDRDVSRLHVPGLDPRWHAAITAAPRRYGLHGTLKAPFVLAEGRTPGELDAALAAFAAGTAAFEAPPLALVALDGFLALVPCERSRALHDLAEGCVARFDGFRAPPPAAELARRRAGGLSPRQDALLVRWGYPHVFEELRFHVTLTGRLEPPDGERARALLAPLVAPFCERPWRVDGISLLRQEDGRPFALVRRYPLAA
jgi:putative phosphonate metabolism protein